MKKQFISAESILLDSYRLAAQIFESGFRPDFIVGLWRGGSPVGIAVQDCLDYLGVNTDHISIRTSYRGLSSYDSMVEQPENIRVHGTQYLFDTLESEHRLLIVDDVYSSGRNVAAVIQRLAAKTRRNMPQEVRIAAPWYKPSNNQTGREPDFYVNTTKDWLVLPYELDGLSDQEIASNKPFIQELLDRYDIPSPS
ncbi:phosphoribosyltransferase [Marinibactrum halimedae]|uniref:Hypoxanthine phosphoribosyltransferase n=1 Tax=Marinibactrum halimedae TaxID=1444977 RepID=A0AA37WP62_9GAMM|nr:phosphoribosyltransferase family protein [Marinibactrum halimedae]MCD9459691.1 hypoxanthine phosphoribosyltransferase [Marinibactrum halimedae]GLS25717.1 hypoxanthine phosphoribosyltransferase [Marinibactrum halimedae]